MPAKLTLAQLRTAVSRQEALAEMLTILEQLGFPTATFQSGGVARVLLETCSVIYEQTSVAVKRIAEAGFLDLATGDFLTALAKSHYDIDRQASVSAEYTIAINGGSSGPPHSIGIGEMVATDGARTFRNVAAFTVPVGGFVSPDPTFRADSPGADGNVTASNINELQTPFAGTSVVTSFAGGPAVLNVQTAAGADEETDTALRERCRTRWSTLAVETTRDALVNLALGASSGIDRVLVDDDNPRGAGTADVYLAGQTGAVGSGDVSAAVSAIAARVMGTVDEVDLGGGNPNYLVQSATAVPVNVTATVIYRSGYASASVEAAVTSALQDAINAVPIGGYDYAAGFSNLLLKNELVSAIESVDGVLTSSMSLPTGNIAMTATQVATVGTISLTMTEATS